MADKTIDEVTPDTNITGTEKLPVSDAGVPKSVTIQGIINATLNYFGHMSVQEIILADTDFVLVGEGDGANIPTSLLKIAEFIKAKLYGEEVAELDDNDVIALNHTEGGTTTSASVAVGDLIAYIQSQLTVTIDIHGKTAIDAVAGNDEMLVADTSASNAVKKATVGQVGIAAIPAIMGSAETVTTAPASDDSVLMLKANGDFKKVPVANTGFSSSNKVTAPAANTNNKIPQWDGANSKTLKDGLELVETSSSGGVTQSNITANSGNNHIPSALAVHYRAEEAKEAAKLASVSRPTDIPAGGGTRVLEINPDGTTVYNKRVTTEISANSTNSQIPTALAVLTAITSAPTVLPYYSNASGGTPLPSAEGKADGTVVMYFNSTTSGAFTAGLYMLVASTGMWFRGAKLVAMA